MPTTAQAQLHQALSQIPTARTSSEITDASNAFQHAFLAFASETDDNRQCVSAVAVESFDASSGSSAGLAVHGVPISSILNAAEGCDIPGQIRRAFPDMQQTDWDHALRVATVILVAFEASSHVTNVA